MSAQSVAPLKMNGNSNNGVELRDNYEVVYDGGNSLEISPNQSASLSIGDLFKTNITIGKNFSFSCVSQASDNLTQIGFKLLLSDQRTIYLVNENLSKKLPKQWQCVTPNIKMLNGSKWTSKLFNIDLKGTSIKIQKIQVLVYGDKDLEIVSSDLCSTNVSKSTYVKKNRKYISWAPWHFLSAG